MIPTLGRASLERTLRSCASADEVVVILDTARGGELPCALPPHAVYAEGHFGVTGGHAGRAFGFPLATGTHLAFMDDDDEYTPGAIELMRSGACERPVIFRMSHYAHGVLWRDPEIRFGNVSTQMYVVPNDPARFGSWNPHIPGLPEPGGDYTFISETCEMMGEPVWREEITTVIRPELHPSDLHRHALAQPPGVGRRLLRGGGGSRRGASSWTTAPTHGCPSRCDPVSGEPGLLEGQQPRACSTPPATSSCS